MDSIIRSITASIAIKQQILNNPALLETIQSVAEVMVKALKEGKRILWCGNGGSAADAQHLAAELSGRFYYDRPPLNSEAMHCNTSYLTAVANDYGYDLIYSRMIDGACKPGDVLVGISTSGNSKNICNAFRKAKWASSRRILTTRIRAMCQLKNARTSTSMSRQLSTGSCYSTT
jgi:D-sedoheptulose 7-phosphate isomerase